MTAVRFLDSLRYAGKLFASVLAVVLLGSAALAGGAALALPERVPAVTGPVTTGRLVGGALLAVLGTAVVVVGLLGGVHKLVADSASAGLTEGDPGLDRQSDIPVPAEGTDSDPPEMEADQGEAARPATAANGPEEAEGVDAGSERVDAEESFDDWVQKTPTEPSDARAASPEEGGAAEGLQGAAEDPGQGDEERREPSPEEIAFGTGTDGSRPGEDTSETHVGRENDGTRTVDRSGADETIEQAGTGGGDPLAERTDEE